MLACCRHEAYIVFHDRPVTCTKAAFHESKDCSMALSFRIEAESFPISGVFTISRGSKTEAKVVTVTVSDGRHTGRGECVPYARYGETIAGVMDEIQVQCDAPGGFDRASLQKLMKPGAARNALDCALWDFEAKSSGNPAAASICVAAPRPLVTAYTLSLASDSEMAIAAKAAAHRPLLKIKVGGEGDIEKLRAVAHAAPEAKIILDANEGWSDDNIEANMKAAADFNVVLIEQPLPAGKDQILRHIAHPVPICADESAHSSAELAALVGLYEAVNIKLDKTGGLTEAVAARDRAVELGFQIMVGCMVGSSLSMAPAVLLAQSAKFVDLDGPLLLARDRSHALVYDGSLVYPPSPALWG